MFLRCLRCALHHECMRFCKETVHCYVLVGLHPFCLTITIVSLGNILLGADPGPQEPHPPFLFCFHPMIRVVCVHASEKGTPSSVWR